LAETVTYVEGKISKYYGYNCQICGFNFENNYGSIG